MTVEGFGSFEEMMRVIGERMDAAILRIKPEQWKLADGKEHWFLKLWSPGPQYEAILIAGHIPDLDEHRRDLIERYGDDEETGYEMRQMRDNLSRGLAFTRSYSVVEPDGEYGDHHISTLLEITREQFEALQAQGFSPVAIQQDPQLIELVRRWIVEVNFQ